VVLYAGTAAALVVVAVAVVALNGAISHFFRGLLT
jgi:hypothetical protein